MRFSATNLFACSVMAFLLAITCASEVASNDFNSLKLKVAPLDRVLSDHANMPKNIQLVRALSGDGSNGKGFRMQDFETVASGKNADSAMQPEEDMSRKLLRGR